MSDLDAAMTAAKRVGGKRPQLDQVLEQLAAEDARQLLEVYLPDRKYSAPQISRALAMLGVSFSRHAIFEWRARNVPR